MQETWVPSLGLQDSPGEGKGYPLQYSWASLVAQLVKNPAMRETWVRMSPWRRKGLPTPVFLPRQFHGKRSLAGYSSWGQKESAKTEQISSLTHYKSHCTEEKMEDQMSYDFFLAPS